MDTASRVRNVLTIWLALACALMALAPAFAARSVRVYEIEVKGETSAQALQEAMRQALVRSTGRREAASDAALSALVSDPARFVRTSRPSKNGTLVVFDGDAIEREIVAAGRSVWERERPFTLIVLSPPPDDLSARRSLENAAEERGLPVSLVPLGITDPATGMELGREALMQAAQRLGGDALLLGRGSAAPGGQWQWTLHTRASSQSWTGPIEAGIHGTVDAIARVEDASFALAESDAYIQVSGVESLTDYAAVGRLLDDVPGVRRVTLEEADGTSATFRVSVRGGAEALDRGLSGVAGMSRAGVANARLMYEFRR